MLSYAFKRVIRSWKLFAALFLGVVLSSTLFAGINIGADTSAKQALDQQLSTITVDATITGSSSLLSSQNYSSAAEFFSSFDSIKKTEIISRHSGYPILIKNETESLYFTVTGIESRSKVYDGLTIVNGSSPLRANETYVVLGSKDQGKLALGDNITLRMDFWFYSSIDKQSRYAIINVTLRVAGFVQLTEQTLSTAVSYYYSSPSPLGTSGSVQYEYNLLLVDWRKTVAPIIDFSTQASVFTTEIAVYIDREKLIDPWDIQSSQLKVNTLMDQMRNKASTYKMYVNTNLLSVLSQYQSIAMSIMFNSLIVALPVFFIAWYMTLTVSNVIFNLRRREIGLLLTKGLSKSQLLRTFLIEALTIGLIGGVVGVALSFLLTPLFVGAFGGKLGLPVIGWSSLILTVSFSMIVTFLAIFQPARKASNLKAIDTLKEYLYTPEERAYRKKLSWAAFILGTYKMAAITFGFSIPTSPPSWMFGNIFLAILYGVGFTLDNVLNYVGPLLFFWGFTKIFIIGSFKFQSLTSKATRKFLGSLSVVAARNVERNPVRVAAIAFLVALIVGHSVSVIGTLASEQDYTVRDVYSSVAADLSVSLFSSVNASQKMLKVAELSRVSATTLEYSFSYSYGDSGVGSASLIAINPKEWLKVAYYEDDWFIGSSPSDALQAMTTDNYTIVLDRSVGKYLNLNKGDPIALTFGNGTIYSLKVVGFFGSEKTQEQPMYRGSPVVSYPSGTRYWSYVPHDLYEIVKNQVSAQARVLAKLGNVRDGESVSNEIQSFSPKIGYVYTVDERLDKLQENALLTSRINVQRIGVGFAVLAASIGTVLVVMVSLNERKREICMMSVRGLSFRQLASILFSEDLVVVLFSVLLGLVSGLIIVKGNVALASMQTFSSNPLLTRHIVFPIDSVLILSVSLALIFASVIVPVILILSRYLTQIDKVVRQV